MTLRPLIGIPTMLLQRGDGLSPVYAVNAPYAHAIEDASGVPVLLPLWERPETLAALRGRLDGLLLMGGGDIDPACFGELAIPQTQPPESTRDALELALTEGALRDGLPILGICRGMQLLNVARGGTLYQDLATQYACAHEHDLRPGEHDHTEGTHSIQIEPGSRLAAILGTESHAVNSSHHQAVNALGDGVQIVARAADGVAEAMELAGYPFVLAVQFHPERMYRDDPVVRRLFAAFVDACQERMTAG